MTTQKDLAGLMATQMLDGQATNRGRRHKLERPHGMQCRAVPLTFMLPGDIPRDQLSRFEQSLKARFPKRPNKHGFVNITGEYRGDNESDRYYRMTIDVVFSIPDFSSRFFPGRQKADFLDEQAHHLTARALSHYLGHPVRGDESGLRKKLSATFPEKRHRADLMLRKLGSRLCQGIQSLWYDIKPVKWDKYRDYD